MRSNAIALVLALCLLAHDAGAGMFGRGNDDFITPTPAELAMTSVPSAPGAPAVILDWIAAWQPAREDVRGLLNAYAEADGGHDISSFTPLLEQLDSSMRLLSHRVDWLRNYLGQSAPKPQNLD